MINVLTRFGEQLLDELRAGAQSDVQHLRCDRWLASSVLQKAIRRGDTEKAQSAALTVLGATGGDFWRRLAVIAYEDVGIGAVNELVRVALAMDAAFRTKCADERTLAMHLVRSLALAPKDRSADYLICGAHWHSAAAKMRAQCSVAVMDQRLRYVRLTSLSTLERATATWFSSGIEWRPEKIVGPGDLDRTFDAFRDFGVPEPLIAATQVVARRTREPIVMMAPVAWMSFRDSAGAMIAKRDLRAAAMCDGLPLYALDKHTRIGRKAITKFARECEAVHQLLCKIAPVRNRIAATAMAAFYADAEPVSQALMWEESRELRTIGIEADMASVLIAPDAADALISVVTEHLGELDSARRHELSQLAPAPVRTNA